MGCEHRKDQLLLYAADLLESAERDALAVHLDEGCPACAATLAEARVVIAQLPLALEPVSPDPALKQRLMRRITEAEGSGVRGQRAESREQRSEAGKPTLSRPWTWAIWGIGSGQHWRRAGGLAVAAGLGFAIGLAAVFPHADRQNARIHELEQSLATLQHERALADDQPIVDDSGLARMVEFGSDVLQTLRSSTLQVISLRSEDGQERDLWARVFWDGERQVGHVITSKVPEDRQDRRYELWLITDEGEAVSAGSFALTPSGHGQFRFGVPSGGEGFTQARIYMADDDDDAPREKPLLVGRLR